MAGAKKRLVFVWENFGPIHADRCDAVASFFRGMYDVIGVELASRSAVYNWQSEVGKIFTKETLFEEETIDKVPFGRRFYRSLKACLKYYKATYFLCHYEHPSTLIIAIVLRCLGQKVFVMNDSKFDDCKRYLWREVLKSVFYLPYNGAIGSGRRTRDYLRFLGIPEEKIASNYDCMAIERIRRLSGAPLAPEGTAFDDRHFTIIARFVPKKNLHVALEAYATFLKATSNRRALHLCGAGQLEQELRRKVVDLNIAGDVIFRGFLQTEEICRTLANTLALVLPSIEEQFGNVVIEAQALSVPVIVAENCGARDALVRSGVNGFVIEPDNPVGLAFFMLILSQNEHLWRQMCLAAPEYAQQGDVIKFVDGIRHLIADAGEVASRARAASS
jgi:L-malate glycosyltransferase